MKRFWVTMSAEFSDDLTKELKNDAEWARKPGQDRSAIERDIVRSFLHFASTPRIEEVKVEEVPDGRND